MKVIYFYAPSWCRTSNLYKYTFDKVAKELQNSGMEFITLDVESKEGVNASIKYTVRNVPTILVIKGNRVVQTIKGGKKTANELKKIIEKWK